MSVDIALPDTMNQVPVWVGHPWSSKSEFLLRIQLDDWWSGHFYCCVNDRLEILPFTNISLVMDYVGGGTLEKLFSEDPLERIQEAMVSSASNQRCSATAWRRHPWWPLAGFCMPARPTFI